MSIPQPRRLHKITVAQYLRYERAADERHMYLDGEIIATAGESGNHADTSANVVGLLHAQLKEKPCRIRTKDTKVRSGPDRPHGSSTKGLFSYPDAVILCGEPVYHDEHHDVVLNPTAIVEVLSTSTELYDRGVKFMRLRNWIPSLQEYVLISQMEPFVEVFHRLEDGAWRMQEFAGLEATAVLAAIDCTLPLAEVYARVEFPSPEAAERQSPPPEAELEE